MVVSSSLVNVFLFKPPRPSKPYDFPSKLIHLTTSRGQRIAATYVRRRGANVTVLFSHGNAEDLNSSYWYLERLAKACDVNVMCYDYTGYGDNDNVPSEEDVRETGSMRTTMHQLGNSGRLRGCRRLERR